MSAAEADIAEEPGGEFREIPAPDGLDALAREAARFDADQNDNLLENPEPEKPAPKVTASSANDWLAAVEFGCGVVISMRPELAEEWTAQQRQALADALAKCGAYYGWNIEKMLGHPLIGLALASFPMVMGLVKVEKARAGGRADVQLAPAADSAAPQ